MCECGYESWGKSLCLYDRAYDCCYKCGCDSGLSCRWLQGYKSLFLLVVKRVSVSWQYGCAEPLERGEDGGGSLIVSTGANAIVNESVNAHTTVTLLVRWLTNLIAIESAVVWSVVSADVSVGVHAGLSVISFQGHILWDGTFEKCIGGC